MGPDALTLTPAAWEPRIAADLGLLRDLEAREVPIYRAAIEAGQMGLLRATRGGELVGWVIWSTDPEPDRLTLVIHAAVILPEAGTDATAELVAASRRAATRLGATSIRCWTTRPGLVRKLQQAGATARTVMELPHG